MKEFRVIPAIDLLDGKVVRLYRGDYSQVTVYSDDPVPVVEDFVHSGASLIHIVDLNAARNGDRSVNHAAIESILQTVSGHASLEIGGGIRDEEALQVYFDHGVDRCILGTSAVKDQEFLKRAVAVYGAERIIVGVDARDGQVKIAGWEQDAGVSVTDFLKQLKHFGIREIIFTDIRTDGTLSGPPVDLLKEILDTSDLRVIASGGISSVQDISDLLSLEREHLVGAITGKAVYEKKLDVKEAIRTVHDTIIGKRKS